VEEIMKGQSGMGMSKHLKSGVAPKSPKLRLRLKIEAERATQKARSSTCKFNSVIQAVKGGFA
jgi:hypothetical protein